MCQTRCTCFPSHTHSYLLPYHHSAGMWGKPAPASGATVSGPSECTPTDLPPAAGLAAAVAIETKPGSSSKGKKAADWPPSAPDEGVKLKPK